MAVFQGVIPVPIASWITTYTPIVTGWSFGLAAWPVEYGWREDAVTRRALALKGTLFDPTFKQTAFSLGDFTAGIAANKGNVIYNKGCIQGFYVNDNGINSVANTYRYSMTPGAALTNALFSGVTYGSITGALFPGQSFKGGSQLGANNVVYAMNDFQTLVLDYLCSWDFGGGMAYGRPSPPGFEFPLRSAFPTDLGYLQADPAGNNWATVGGSGAGTKRLALCNFAGTGNLDFYELTWDNATIDGYVTALFNASGTRPTPFGWLTVVMNNTTSNKPVTIGGKTYTSYMILTSLDGTKWWLMNIIGQDANGANWQGNIGTASACIFPNGQMVIHHNAQDAIVLASLNVGTVAYQLPVYPPMKIPNPPPDTEVSILPFEAVTKSGEH